MFKKLQEWFETKVLILIQNRLTEYSKSVDAVIERTVKQMDFYHTANQKYTDDKIENALITLDHFMDQDKAKTNQYIESQINNLQDSIDNFDRDIHQNFNNIISRLEDKLNIVTKELEELKLIETNRKAKLAIKESDKPWVDWCGDEIDENGMIKLKLDWNQPMIKLLQENGYQGTDEQIIQKWLYLTLQEVATEEANNIPKFNE